MNILDNLFKSSIQKDPRKLDFIAIGDTAIDQFIKLKDAHETVNKDTSATELCMIFGTKLPFEFAKEVIAVGNSANAAVSAARLGLSSGLISHIGDDENGKKCLNAFKKEGVCTEFIEVHKGLKTNYHFVLWFGSERTILIKHEDYPLTLPDIGSPKWIYLSSLSDKSLPFHTKLAEYLSVHKDTKLIFQPGTYQIKFGTEALAAIYKHTELFFCNVEEAEIILNIKNDASLSKHAFISKLLAGLRTLGVKLPVITDGPHGAYTYIKGGSGTSGAGANSANNSFGAEGLNSGTQYSANNSGDEEYVGFMPVYPDIAPPYERTGAGDSFASTFSSAIALGKSTEEALKWASINSMSVCQKVGAQEGLLSQEAIAQYIEKAPIGWGVQRVF